MSQAIHVVLRGTPKPRDTPSYSGFCQKLETFLRHSGISYELKDVYPNNAPRKKVPFAEITHEGRTETVTDSHFIVRYLVEHELIKDPDETAELTAEERAESRAFQAYVEETLYSAVCYERWFIAENRQATVKEIFGNEPWLVRVLLTWYFSRKVQATLWTAGIGRHSWAEVQTLQREAVGALEAKLRGRRYFHGDGRLSRIDLTVFGFLANTLTTEGNPHFTGLVLRSDTLRAFVRAMAVAWFPEYRALVQRTEEERRAIE